MPETKKSEQTPAEPSWFRTALIVVLLIHVVTVMGGYLFITSRARANEGERPQTAASTAQTPAPAIVESSTGNKPNDRQPEVAQTTLDKLPGWHIIYDDPVLPEGKGKKKKAGGKKEREYPVTNLVIDDKKIVSFEIPFLLGDKPASAFYKMDGSWSQVICEKPRLVDCGSWDLEKVEGEEKFRGYRTDKVSGRVRIFFSLYRKK